MDLPTPRELELETLLRQRDTQVTQLTDEVTRLRNFLVAQPSPATTDPVALPPALTSLLIPHFNAPSKNPSSTSVTAALTQRTRLLQEENDELYDLLRQSETGKLKEEVRGLRHLVERLENALRESHQIVLSLSTELEKSYEIVLTTAPRAEKPPSRSPRNSYHVPLPSNVNGASSKALPTGPRAHKKPRLTGPDPQPSPPPPISKQHQLNSHSSSNSVREPSPRPEHRGKGITINGRMAVDELKPRPHSPLEREKDKDSRHRDRERRDDRDRDRDRDVGRRERRNGTGGGGGRSASGPRRGGADRGAPAANNNSNAYQGGDRTLKERLGL